MNDLPEHVAYFRLSSLKGRIKLESVGLKHSGGATRPKIAKEFGLSPRAPHAEFIKAIQAKMDELIAAKAERAKAE